MENLELSLTSLGTISRHIDKSHNELSKYLAKQIWSQQDRQCILGCLAQLLLEKDYTLLIARHLRPLVLDLLQRNAERIKADVRLNHDLHERLCVAVSKLLSVSPDAQAFAARYFRSAPPVFQRLFFTSEESASIQYGPRRMKLRDLMGATLRFLQSDCEKFRVLWDWSVCVSQLLTSDVMVRGYTAQCLALVSHMTDNQKTIFLRKVLSSEEILHIKMKSLEESQQLEVEKALVLANQGSAMWRLERGNKFTKGQVMSEDLSQSVASVCGVILPRLNPRQEEQVSLKNLVLVDSTCRNLRRLAMAVASQKPVLLEGPIGCGKTALVEYLAAVTGHVKAPDILKVQLGDQTDSKMLLGMYRCTDVPGKFMWQAGSLTQAVSKGHWILLEDIDHAALDVISVLLPLIENKKLTIPGREDCIQVAPGFQFFATRRMFYSGGVWHRPQSTHASLLDKYWSKLQLGSMTRDELKQVLLNRYPSLAAVVDRLLDIYCQLTGDRHHGPGVSSPWAPPPGQNPGEERAVLLEGRGLSLRDLLKWCERICVNFDSSSSATAQNVFLEALDCFTAMLSKAEARLKLAEIIGGKLNISREKAQHFCQLYQPGMTVTELEMTVGRATLLRKQSDAVRLEVERQTFASTRPSLVLLEQLAVCVTKGEPVLLVGETGTGKTSTVQYLAGLTGHKLRVVNMNQQSDTADLLGGYKPVDHKLLLLPLREAFEDLFSQTYSRKQNITFLGHVQTCFRGKRWQDLLKLMDHVCKSALTKELQEKPNAALLQERWEALAQRLSQTQEQIRARESALVFAFVEGALAQAVKKGEWILLDEINLAAAETLECLSGLLEGNTSSLVLLDRGDTEPLVRNPDFRLFACMNPATDVGKRNLPLGIRNRFTELYVEELESEGDLRILVSDYLKSLHLNRSTIHGIISFYLAVRKEAGSRLADGMGHKPHYSLRTLCRALKYVASNPCYNVQRSLYEGFCLSFLTQLDRSSHPVVEKMVYQYILGGNVKCLKQPIPEPRARGCVPIEGYWVSQGDMDPALDPSYILTPSVQLNLRDLARAVAACSHPVLLQGETSVGKTSLVRWLAAATGNQCVRINNHEHTDIQEYVGCYSSDEHGKLIFKEGVLIDAMRKGYWIILDELNLAPTDVLEALNRLLDDNRELFIAETQEVVKANPRFMLFATQNPPGLYGGRKVLSRAFRNRFVELHFDELPGEELETILYQRCSLPPSYCTKLVKVMQNLQSLRRGSSVLAGKHGFITLRDLFRWAERYRLEEQTDSSRDWLQHLADDGYMLLAGRVRKPEEALTIQNILEKHFKRTINPEALFSEAQVTTQFSPFVDSIAGVPEEFGHVVWTQGMRRLAVLAGRALRFGESVLLVGDTGCGKTTICQLFAALSGQKFFSLNCHLHMETSDFLGGLRPVRHGGTGQADAEDGRLFEWRDGPLVLAMKHEGVFLMDEISLADDSVLERLNSVLETEKSLVLAEKGSGDDDDVELIIAGKKFRLVATMNPGGDFGKKELSPALRNRFTEIWCPQTNSRSDLMKIIQHNLRAGLSLDQHDHQGKDIAELMLNFIDWLTNQEFGRRCILSIRDILSWVDFLNAVCERDEDRDDNGFLALGDVEEPEWDLRLDTVTAFVHAACLVYVDGIGSGTTALAAESAAVARRACLAFLEAELRKVTPLDEKMHEALRVYDASLLREPRWGEDFFGIDPFYIITGPESDGRSLSDYALGAGTTAVNAMRILRALKLQRPILLEGSPGVGKTSLVAALAKASGNHLVRINLSEQTDVTDLFGTDLPVEGGKGGEFAWRDGPLLAALKAGHWVVLDELNLASQSVLEGLNACFDHRAEVYIPELSMRFQVQHEKTKIFGCQNPFMQGGGRKGLPKSFLNRFTQVFVDQLTSEDMQFIGSSIFPNISEPMVSKMVQFSNRLVHEVAVERKWGQKGGPWEFNLRDLFRWCQLMQADQSPAFYNPGQHVGLVYADRMRTEYDKAQVLSVFRKVFAEDFEPYLGSRQFHITPLNLQVGSSVLQRSGGPPVALDPPLSITHQALRPLESLMKCVKMGWMAILVGPSASGKGSLVHLLALLTGHRLRVMAMNSAMDTTELLGGFEQVDIIRPWQQVLESMDYVVAMVTRRGLMSLDGAVQDTEFLLSTWSTFRCWLRDEGLDTTDGTVTFEALNKLEVIIVLLHKLNTKLKVFTDMSKLQMDFTLLKERLAQMEDGWSHGGFEWLDGMLVQALQAGDWLLMDNVNFCSPSVLDRLNALLEPGGSLTINERGVIDGTTPSITPHPNFRLFLTMDPAHGEISRAMRNRGVEIYIPGENEGASWDSLDLKTVLHTLGVIGDCVCDILMSIHSEIKATIWDSPASSVSSLLHAATLLSAQLQRGVDLPSALLQACGEAYSLSQRTAANQQLAQEVLERQLAVLDSEEWGSRLLCAGVWPDHVPSALQSTEDSCFSSVQRDGQVLLCCLNTLSLHGRRSRPLSLTDLQRAMQSGAALEGLQFSGGDGGAEGGLSNAQRLLPTAVRILTERASHSDWVLRNSWLSHLAKSYKHVPDTALMQLEAGSRALKAVFNSKLISKGKYLTEHLQPHSTDDYRILVDMRWNKQYLDILANTCNFEDEERCLEFMEALYAVANRIIILMDQEERAAMGSSAGNASPHNSALSLATAFSKGTVDIGHLPHPVLVHLRAFFDLWDSFVLQAVQSDQPNISDHLMFEILQLLQWRDRFWHVCGSLPADARGVCILSLHWQWVHKNLVLRMPQLLMGDGDYEGQQELHTISTAIQNTLSSSVSVASALKNIQKTLGKPMPFKVESVADCASHLRVLSRALDVKDLRLDSSMPSLWKREVARLRAVAMGIDTKEALLEGWGLVLQANLLLEPQSAGVMDRLHACVDQQQSHMACCGLLDSLSEAEEEAAGEGATPGREVLLQLARRAQIWPALEVLAVLNQMKVTVDLLHLSVMQRGHKDAEAGLRRSLSNHLRFCMQSTPMNIRQLLPLWFLLSTERPVEELPLVWCELLSETLAALWSSSVTSDPERWLKWSPLSPEEPKSSRPLLGPSDTGPGMLSRAVWSRCILGVLSGSEGGGHWDPSGTSFLSSSRVTLGEWRERVGQLQDLSTVLWDNMAMPELADFRLTDRRLQGLVLCRQLHSLSELLSPGLQESYAESCEALVDGQDPIGAAQEIQVALREGLPENLLPEGFLDTLATCLTQFSHNRAQDTVQLARSGVFWVNMGLLQIQVWAPQTIFDPAVKRAYKLSYAQDELALLQDEWRGRSLSSQLLTGVELEESSTTDAFQHPRVRYLWIRMQQVREQICELGRKQACRPADPQYGQLYQELQHYLCSIGQPAAVGDLLSHLLKALQGPGPKSRPGIQGLLKEEAVWQASQQRFAQRLADEYPLYPDVVVPLRCAILQLRHGMRLLAARASSALAPPPPVAAPHLLTALLAGPAAPPLASDLARADFLCSRACAEVLASLARMLPADEAARVVPKPAMLLLAALLRLQCHTLSAGLLEMEAQALLRHVCQALVNEWDEQERRAREQEQREASLYRGRSRLHGGGLTEEQQEERDFRRSFPTYHKDFADITAEPSLEQPIIIEDDEDCDGKAESSQNGGFLLPSCQNTVIQVHQRLCLSYAQSLWYQPSLPTNQSKDHISALVTSYQITAPLITRFYHLMDCELDPQLISSQLLLSSLLQNTVRGSGGPAGLLLSSEGPYDFYQQPNMSQARLCLPALEQLGRAVRRRLDDWPGHPALLQITVVMERILNFSLSSPLAKFLNGLEILLSKAQDWESNASRSVSLRTELEPITQLIIQWRKLELRCWSSSLDNAMKRHAENSNKHWFNIYQLVERYLQEKRMDLTSADGGVEELSLSSVSSTLQGFMEGSTLGEFHTRLTMLLTFHCHILLAPKQEGHALLCSLLWNLHKYYAQFSESVQSRITQLRTPIEKELKDFVKISKWNDVSFWSVKQSVEKTHRTLFRFTRKFEAALAEPCTLCLVEQGSSSLDSVDPQLEETPLHRLHRALGAALPGRGRDLQSDGPEEVTCGTKLQARLPFLTRRMRKMCVQLVKKAALPELTEDLDQFTVEIITNMQALQSLSVDRSLEQERQRAEVKHILLQKRRALADLFKMLAQIGLSYRKGLTWGRTAHAQEPLCLQPVEMSTALSVAGTLGSSESMLFAEMTSAWEGCQKYFYRSWARRNAMQAAMQTAAKELGLGSVERCRGFSSHLFKLLLHQRRRLARLTDLWVQLRKQLSNVQDIRSQLSRSGEEEGCILPPQEPLRGWVTRACLAAHQCCMALQHLSWTLQCCPEGPSGGASQPREGEAGQGKATLSHPSPLAAHLQPQASLMRRGEASWQEAVERAEALQSESERLKQKLNALKQEASDGVIHTWSHVEQCGVYVYSLGALSSQMATLEQLFTPEGTPVLQTPPGLTRGLHAARGEADACVSEFTTWRTQMLSFGQGPERTATAFQTEFSEQVGRTINTVLCAVQSLVKRREREEEGKQQSDSRRESDSEVCEELLKPGHLSQVMEEGLSGDAACLALPEVIGVMGRLLEMLRCHSDAGPTQDLAELREACRELVQLEPILGVYSELARWYMAMCMGTHRSTGKLLSVLTSIFTDLAQKGFCLPQELMEGGDGEGAPEFHDYEGGGIGEGEGVKDVSDKIENEDQVEDTFREGQEKREEEPDQRDVKEEDNAIEMSEDFDGKTYDGEAREADEDEEDSDKEENEELDKKMGDLGDGPTDTLDERMWGDEDEDDDDLDGSDKEEQSGPGMDQGESELVAKDDNAEASESNKDQLKQEKEHTPDVKDEREEVHEQVDEREFDENEVDPYHGKQEKAVELEGTDLPEELNLDSDDQGGEDEEGEQKGENPYDIDDKPMEVDEAEGEGEEGEEEDGGGETQGDQQGDQREEEMKAEKEVGLEEEGRDSKSDESGESEGGENEEAEEQRGEEHGRGEDEPIPADQGKKPKEEEQGSEDDDDDAQVNTAERKEHATEGQTGEENVQSDTAMELAGAASERDQAKEEHGSGAADASQAEGHDSKLMARMSSQRRREKHTQSFKRKPGHADNKRSLGDATESVHKRLRTVERAEQREQEEQRLAMDTSCESDLYEHIKQGEKQYDTQTYDTASTEQQKPTGIKPEIDSKEDDDDVAMDTEEEDLQAVEAPKLKPEKLDSSSSSRRGLESGELESQRDSDEEKKEKAEMKSSSDEEERRERSMESTIHTVPELLTQTLQLQVKDPELLRKELELQLEDWQRRSSGSQEEEKDAAVMWQQYQALTSPLSQQLCEQLRLILEPTQAAKLKGDYRTGKRLNMRKVIPYIASQFRKDKIWLRRTKPSKRDYQICLAVDDSSSMVDNHSKQMAFESVSVIVNALTLLEVGQVAVCSFGESVQLLHPFHQQFNDQSGARVLRLCQFQQKKTRIAQFLETSANMFVAAKQQNPSSPSTETAQLLLIVSDGRGLFLEGKERVATAVQAARSANVFVIFVVLDNPNSRDSILDIKVPIFKGPGELPEIRSYMEEFPFPFYVILRDVNALPETLSDALRQWFELVTATDQ
ncbi:midasin isoform X1 [Electrophorus electricus]|uniref:midasin isoform X1 n=1 Tax=Electrophorus electricus TaxID=8005 RepID=UPI0015CFFDD0|nr:midasin isoform X1 [Electrophorus electricus]